MGASDFIKKISDYFDVKIDSSKFLEWEKMLRPLTDSQLDIVFNRLVSANINKPRLIDVKRILNLLENDDEYKSLGNFAEYGGGVEFWGVMSTTIIEVSEAYCVIAKAKKDDDFQEKLSLWVKSSVLKIGESALPVFVVNAKTVRSIASALLEYLKTYILQLNIQYSLRYETRHLVCSWTCS